MNNPNLLYGAIENLIELLTTAYTSTTTFVKPLCNHLYNMFCHLSLTSCIVINSIEQEKDVQHKVPFLKSDYRNTVDVNQETSESKSETLISLSNWNIATQHVKQRICETFYYLTGNSRLTPVPQTSIIVVPKPQHTYGLYWFLSIAGIDLEQRSFNKNRLLMVVCTFLAVGSVGYLGWFYFSRMSKAKRQIQELEKNVEFLQIRERELTKDLTEIRKKCYETLTQKDTEIQNNALLLHVLKIELHKTQEGLSELQSAILNNNGKDVHLTQALDTIDLVNKKTYELEKSINSLTGTKQDKDYLSIHEQLIRNSISLDNIESRGNELIKNNRREAMSYVNMCFNLLEESVQQK